MNLSKAFLFLVLCFLSLTAVGQKDIVETEYPVQDLILGPDKKEAWFTSGTHLYQLDLENFEVLDSLDNPSDEYQVFKDLRFWNDSLLEATTSYANGHRSMAQEYPFDSTYVYDIKNKFGYLKVPGHIMFSETVDSMNFVTGYNSFYESTIQGNSFLMSDKGEILSYIKDVMHTKIPSPGRIQRMELGPERKRLLVVYYEDYTEEMNRYRIELRSFPELDLLESTFFEGEQLQELFFSENGKYFAVRSLELYQSKQGDHLYTFFSFPELEALAEVPVDFSYGGLIQNQQIWLKEDGDFVLKDMNSNDILKTVWPNLTPFSFITGFEVLDQDHLLVYGEKNTISASPSINGVHKFSLKGEQIYVDQAASFSVDSLFSPKNIALEDNRFLESKAGSLENYHSNQEQVVFSSGNRVQLWDKKSRKKLQEWNFENEVKAFLGKDAQTVLVFGEHNNMYSGEFTIGALGLATGALEKRVFSGEQDFSPMNPSCECYELEAQNTWICAGGYLDTGIWKVNAADLSIEKLTDIEDPELEYLTIEDFQHFPGSGDFLFTTSSEVAGERTRLTDWVFRTEDNSLSEIKLPENYSRYHPLSENELLLEKDGEVFLFDIKGRSEKIFSASEKELTSILFSDSRNYIVMAPKNSLSDSLSVYELDEKNKLVDEYSISGNAQKFFSVQDGFAYAREGNLRSYFPRHKREMPWSRSKSLYIDQSSLSSSEVGKLLFKDNWIIDLSDLQIKRFQEAGLDKSIILRRGSIFRVMQQRYEDQPFFQFQLLDAKDPTSIIWQSQKFEMKHEAPETLLENERYVLAYYKNNYGEDKMLYLVDLQERSVKQMKEPFKIADAFFSKDEQHFFLRDIPSYPDQSQLYTYSTRDLGRGSEYEGTGVLEFLDEKRFLSLDYDQVQIKELQGEVQNSFYAREFLRTAGSYEAQDLVYAGSHTGSLFFWVLNNSSPKKKFNLGSSEVISLQRKNDQLYVLLKEGSLHIFDLDSLELLVSLHLYEEEEELSVAWITPEGFFKSSKENIRNYHFVKNQQAFPLLNYELFLNRPDIIMQNLGYAKTEVVEIYREAYEKRLQRHGYDPKSEFALADPLQLSLLNEEQIPVITEEEELALSIEAPKAVQKIAAYINGVPVKNISAKNKNSFKIRLNSGLNQVSIIGADAEGVETSPINLEVTSTQNKEVPKLHYFGIGVSEYEDASMNLRFADKDVRKMSEELGFRFKDRLVVDTLINEQVTRENLDALKTKLENTGINDIIIISFSGHGLIDEDNDFYFATHDVDFEDPSKKGYSYEQVYALLDNIPARRKLLLLDACNSGEIDDEEDLKTVALNNSNVSQHIPEGAKGSKVVKSSSNSGLESSFEVMRSLFYDLDRGNGAYVISAAGGKEFAYESEDWGNGVFTYSFLNALDELGYSWGGSAQPIKVSQIKNFVENMVLDLTNGQQKPTSRSENIEWDWELK